MIECFKYRLPVHEPHCSHRTVHTAHTAPSTESERPTGPCTATPTGRGEREPRGREPPLLAYDRDWTHNLQCTAVCHSHAAFHFDTPSAVTDCSVQLATTNRCRVRCLVDGKCTCQVNCFASQPHLRDTQVVSRSKPPTQMSAYTASLATPHWFSLLRDILM